MILSRHVAFFVAAAFLLAACGEKKTAASLPPHRKEVPLPVSTPSPVVPPSPAAPAPAPDSSIDAADAKAVPAGDAPPRAVLGKMDAHLARGLEKLAASTPLEPKAARLQGIPMNDEGTVCIDLEAAPSEGLLAHLAAVGGTLVVSPEPGRIVTATVPFAALPALAARGDVRSVSISRPTAATSGVQFAPEAP